MKRAVVAVAAGVLAIGAGVVATASPACACAAPSPEAARWPAVTGAAQTGQTVTTDRGTWVTSGVLSSFPNTGYGYQWQSCDVAGANCTPVSGATSSTYTVGSGDAGKTVRSAITATNAGGSTTQTSQAVLVSGTGGSGGGPVIFDGTFTSPPPGTNYPLVYSTPTVDTHCLSYISSTQVGFNLASSSPQCPRVDLCTVQSCNSDNAGGFQYVRGTSYCTSVPFYTPGPKLTSSGWYQIAEMKDSQHANFGDWTFNLGDGSASVSVGFSDGTYYNNTNAWQGSPATAGWHTFSICANGSDTVYGIWYDGVRETFNIGHCSGVQTCTGMDLFSQSSMGGTVTKQPLDLNAYTGSASASTTMFDIIHGDPLVSACTGSQCYVPPEPRNGWTSAT